MEIGMDHSSDPEEANASLAQIGEGASASALVSTPPTLMSAATSASIQAQAHLEMLPTEIQLQIFLKLDFPSALSFCSLSRSFHASFHQRQLPRAEIQRFLSLIENKPRNGGPFRSMGLSCFTCCRVRPHTAFDRREILHRLDNLPMGAHSLTFGNDKAHTDRELMSSPARDRTRFCIECGVDSGYYGPGTILYEGAYCGADPGARLFTCKLCGQLEHSKPPSCGKDLICTKCWASKEGLEKTLCTRCKLNRAREKDDERKAKESKAENSRDDSSSESLDSDSKVSSGGQQGKLASLRESFKNGFEMLKQTLTRGSKPTG